MTPTPRARVLFRSIAIMVAACGFLAAARAAQAPTPAVLVAMKEEIDRSMAAMSKGDPAAYFISSTVADRQYSEVSGSNGALLTSTETRARWLEVQTRVGTYQLDDSHKLADRQPSWTSPGTSVVVDDDIPALRRKIWLETNRQYRAAGEALIKVRTSQQVQVQTAEGNAPDFSREKPHVSIAPRIQSKAADGMDINRYANFDWLNPKDAPDDQTVFARIQVMIAETEALDKAPLVDPYAGPAMLTGRAAAVFFHEVFGHRAEGFRQKDINEGQTFTSKVGEQILPDFISIKDDPTEAALDKQMLLGNYAFDDEGVPAENVQLVDHGVLKTFLMSRSPLVNIPQSNGHGRRQLGFVPVARQGNLIVSSSKAVSNDQLRQQLIDLVKAQGKPFGLLIDDIAGGFTFTGRQQPQAFQVLPLVVYKVYADGRPDQLVRGVDIVGTPLVSLTKIVATGDTPDIFNGYCGAESGSVPVSAVAPAILISEMEVQKKETSTDKPPILPPPAHDPEGHYPGQNNTAENNSPTKGQQP